MVNPLVSFVAFELKIKPSTNKGLNKQIKTRKIMYSNITSTWYALPKRPEAFITKAKKRIKQFSGQVYLNDGDEYEIELFNPTQEVVLAKIKLDGNYISGGGIVLRRGERVFLERFLDSPNKLKKVL